MYKVILVGLFLLGSLLQAQTKKPPVKGKKTKVDSLALDSIARAAEVPDVKPTEFIVYTKRSKKQKTKLCINLVSQDSILNYCMSDSVLHDPEFYKILFEARDMDSTYSLVYVRAFTKDPDRQECYSGKEVKLYFVRWNTSTNKATVKSKYIESCRKGITTMSKDPIETWTPEQPLVINYNQGLDFIELRFDPSNYKVGMQSVKEIENK